MLRSLTFWRAKSQIWKWPFLAARRKGVNPSELHGFFSSSASNNVSNFSVCPVDAAKYNCCVESSSKSIIDKVSWILKCTTETRIRYREPKPKSNFGIGIGAEIFFPKPKLFFSNFSDISHFFLGDMSFWKLVNKPRYSKIIWKHLRIGSNLVLEPFCDGKNTPYYQ